MVKAKQIPRGSGLLFIVLSASVFLACSPAETPPERQGLDLQAHRLTGGGHPFAVVARDLNGDQEVDLAVTNPKVGSISVYLGRGDGTFQEPTAMITGKRPRGLVVADLDGDDVPDLAVACTGDNAVFVHRGRGDGGFESPQRYPVGARPFMLEPVDLNRDGRLDLVVANEGERAEGRALSVLLADADGRFSVRSFQTGKYGSDVAVADFNRDGRADVAVSTWGTNDVHLHLGQGDGTFVKTQAFTYVGHGLYRVFAADLNRDENPDMIWNDLRRNGLYLLYGDGKGGFPQTRLLPAGKGVRHALASDLNQDGWPDLISANTGAGGISVILSDGKGDYLPTQNFETGEFPRMVAVADLDKDQRSDLVVTNLRSDDLVVLFNRGPAPLQVVAREPEQTARRPHTRLELASFRFPNGLAMDPSGDRLLVSDQQNHRIAEVDIASGKITTVAGRGTPGGEGDGGPAIGARLHLPADVVVDGEGNIYIADFGNSRVRKVDSSGTITTVAGTGEMGFSGDGGPATEARLGGVFALALDGAGNLYLADFGNKRVRKVDSSGIITTVAGTGRGRRLTDGEPGTRAGLGSVTGLALDAEGNLLMADQYSDRVLKLRTDGTIITLAGSGKHSPGGDGGPAVDAYLSYPAGVAADTHGNVYIADQDGNRIRKVTPDGIIHTLAGDVRQKGHSGDGGPASNARIWFPFDVVTDLKGNLYFTDRFNHCIRKIDASGIISTVAGSPDPEMQPS
jgi:DNA-binding beta-propeller fold protein YncE